MAGFDFGQSAPIQGQGNYSQQYNRKTGQWETPTGFNNGNPVFASDAANSGTKTPAQVITDIINNGTDAVPAGLKALGSFSTNTMTSSAGVSKPIQDASDQTAAYISNLVGKGADPSGLGAQSNDFISQMLKGQGPTAAGTAAMTGALKPTDTSYLDTGAAATKAHTLADTDISKYMNPALGAEEAAILHGGDVQNNAIRARQARSGAFGANSDVAQTQQNELTQRQLALAGSDAFKNASANAQSDVGALNSNDQSNRAALQSVNSQKLGAGLTDAQRQLTGGAALNSGAAALGGQAWQQYLQTIGMGTNLASSAASSLAALPGGKTLTTQGLGPSQAGAELGGYIGLTGLQQQYSKPNTGFQIGVTQS